jgi:DNA-directed RNA polymerase subunit RPC12/RpoP
MGNNWKCQKCGRQKGDFELLGVGLVKCPSCGAMYFVEPNGQLALVADYGIRMKPEGMPRFFEDMEEMFGD